MASVSYGLEPMLSSFFPDRITKALLTAALLSLSVRSDAPSSTIHAMRNRMATLPHRTLWTWEHSEDLVSIDPRTTAVAYLDRTLLLNASAGEKVMIKPRRQPLTLPADTTQIAVVRIEARPGLPLDSALEEQTVDRLLEAAQQPAIAAFQVDFDATRSQRAFYGHVIRKLRSRMPAGLPLSITALASWCSYDDWIADLPVDEAVPMLFRMEPDRRRAGTNTYPDLEIREPLCRDSVGISTHEAWPPDLASRRMYIFPDRGWRNDLPTLGLPLLAQRKLP